MVFGESVLNDAVAIVLSTTLLSFTEKEVNSDSIVGAVVMFVTIFVGSLVRRSHFIGRTLTPVHQHCRSGCVRWLG
jgi:NhaP-type Na+/H+ or K+/H+ antiporter